jgi:hypothetical protein
VINTNLGYTSEPFDLYTTKSDNAEYKPQVIMAEGGKSSFRPPKQWSLTDNETISSFANWKSNMLYNLSLNDEFSQFLDSEWSKKSVANRGLSAKLMGTVTKTATQRAIVLERMLGLVAQFSPSLLRTEIMKRSTSLEWIWTRLRKHYSFSASEANFLKLSGIKREENERYETFYQRIVAHIEDNLLTTASGILFDGEVVEADEEISPTTERLAVYFWLTKIDERLPAFVARIYAHELQFMSLKDIQPRIAESMDSLLTDLAVQDDIKINFSNTQRQQRQYPQRQYPRSSNYSTNKSRFNNNNRPNKPSQQNSANSCLICKAAGKNPSSHKTSDCWFISKFDKLQLSKALRVDTDDLEGIIDEDDPEDYNVDLVDTDRVDTDFERSIDPYNRSEDEASFNRVDCDTSPFLYAFHNHIPCHVVIDTGATSSLISKSFVAKAGLAIKPTRHSARSVDKSSLNILGEVHVSLNYDKKILPLTALVVDRLDCDILGGVPFCKQNDISVLLKKEQVLIGESKFSYGKNARKPSVQEILRCESFILRNDSPKVLLPGDYVEFSSQDLSNFDGEIAIEPHSDSPLKGSWPSPAISRVINGTVRIQNNIYELV